MFSSKPANGGYAAGSGTEAWHVGDAAHGIAVRVLARSRNEVCCHGDAASERYGRTHVERGAGGRVRRDAQSLAFSSARHDDRALTCPPHAFIILQPPLPLPSAPTQAKVSATNCIVAELHATTSSQHHRDGRYESRPGGWGSAADPQCAAFSSHGPKHDYNLCRTAARPSRLRSGKKRCTVQGRRYNCSRAR